MFSSAGVLASFWVPQGCALGVMLWILIPLNLFHNFSYVDINVSSYSAGPLGNCGKEGTAKSLRKSASPSSQAYSLANQLQGQFTEFIYNCYLVKY